jgi:chromosome partitioning protein
MITVAILSQKGGAGKTTLAVNLAAAAELKKMSAAVIDLDPQASATAWGDSRQGETPAVVSAQAARLPKILGTCRDNGADFVIIDTAPHVENSALVAARAADLIIVPCRPSIVDLRAIESSVNISTLAGKPVCVVLNQVPPRGTLAAEAGEALKELSARLSPVQIGNRIAFIHAFTDGLGVVEYEPAGKAASEISRLFGFILKTVKDSKHGKEKQSSRRAA